jgi:regulator of extracellular matrix RemA (YlzA/DUF370 family)
MPTKLVNIGYNNFVSAERVVAIVAATSTPARRLRDEAKEQGLLVDATTGHRLRSMIVTSSRHLVLTSVEVVTLVARYNEACLEFVKSIGYDLADGMETKPEPEIVTPKKGRRKLEK